MLLFWKELGRNFRDANIPLADVARGLFERGATRDVNVFEQADASAVNRPATAIELAARHRPVFGTLTMPNGEVIRTMREDAFQAALSASGNKVSR